MPRIPGFATDRPLIGAIHLPPLPGRDSHLGMERVLEAARLDAAALAEGGADAALIENYGDAPFHKGDNPPHVAAALALATQAAREAAPGLQIGVNALRNDWKTALGVAAVTRATFVRVNVLSGAMITDQGLIEGDAAGLADYRRLLGARVAVLADVHVKHATPWPGADLAREAQDAYRRGRADALVVSGPATGQAPDAARLKTVREAVPEAPILVGSGLSPESPNALHTEADGAIVATSLQGRGGRISAAKVQALKERLHAKPA